MYFAALGDVNGNARALEAVLDTIAELGVLTVFQTGNLVVGRGGAREVMALLSARRLTYVQGVTDRDAVRFHRKRSAQDGSDALAQAVESLSSDVLESLGRLPSRLDVTLENLSILICHGSVSNPSEILSSDSALMKLQRQRELAPVDIIVCGGAHDPFSRWVEGTLFVGPGWVDYEPGVACYSIIDTEREPWAVEARQVRFNNSGAPPA